MSPLSIAEAASRCPEQEWTTRVELAALYRVIHHYGMTDIANQEIGARVHGEPERFLIHPYGLLFEEVRASNLVKVSLDGAVIDGPGIWAGSGRESFVEHATERWVSDGGVNLGKWIFGARPDYNFFIHGHCEDVMAVSATEGGLRPLSQAYIYLREHITYLDYDFAEDDEYAASFHKAIAGHDIIVSHHHGYYAHRPARRRRPSSGAFYLRQGLLGAGQGRCGRSRRRRAHERDGPPARRDDRGSVRRVCQLPLRTAARSEPPCCASSNGECPDYRS